MNKVIHGDCLEVMPTLPSKSIDLVVADPPYNIGKAAWDKIPDYVEWMGEVFKQCERLLKDNGSFYFFHNDFLQIVELQKWLSDNTAFLFKQFITWCKIDSRFRNYGFAQQRLSNGTARNYYGGFTEYCLFYTFQDETGLSMINADHNCYRSIKKYLDDELEQSEYNEQTIKTILQNDMASHYFGFSKRDKSQFSLPTQTQYKKLQTTGRFSREYEDLRREYEDLRREYEDLRYAYNVQTVKGDIYSNSNVWKYPPAPQIGHITPKPTALIENILLHSSNEGDTVFDPCGGSGTTAIACINTNRNYILIEKEQEYIGIINKRISEHEKQLAII